jgi:hypothetical protein
MRYDKSVYHRVMFLTSYPVIKSETPARYGLPLKKRPPTSFAEIASAEIAHSMRKGTG